MPSHLALIMFVSTFTCIGLAPGWRAEGGEGEESGEVFSRLEGGGRRGEVDEKGSFTSL